MINSRRYINKVILAFIFFAQTAPAYAQTNTHLGVPPSAMLTLVAAVAVGNDTNLTFLGSGEDFVVPSGRIFVLTDIII